LFDPAYGYLFNSYYETVGPRHPRPARGLLSRPASRRSRAIAASYRWCDEALILTTDEAVWRAIVPLIELGLNHEDSIRNSS